MPKTDDDRLIALAALFQSAGEVRRIARHGQWSRDCAVPLLHSLITVDAQSSEAVYDGLAGLRSGLHHVQEQLRKPGDMELTRYVVNLLALERKLARRKDLLQRLADGIGLVRDRLEHFDLEHDNTAAAFADLYASTISTLSPRIMVNGEPEYLQQPRNANRIRAMLLAGIRAAILWRQSGGSRLTLLFRRSALLAGAQRMLATLPEPPEQHTGNRQQ